MSGKALVRELVDATLRMGILAMLIVQVPI